MSDAELPLIATADELLLDDALRWCAAVGATPEVTADTTATRRSWRRAPVVVVGEDLADGLARAGLQRRDHVLLVARKPERWWPAAVALGAVGVFRPDEEERILEALSAGRRGLRSMVLDADPLGGGIELVLGAERAEGLRWRDVDATRGTLSAGSLAEVLPTHHRVATLSWDRSERPVLPDSLPSVLAAAVRGFDLVVADVPRHLDTWGSDIVSRSVLTVLVVAEEICAVGAARHVLARVQECTSSIAVVSVSRPGGIGPDAVAEALGQPVLARHRLDRRIRSAVDRGHGPGRSRSARRTSGVLLDALGLESG